MDILSYRSRVSCSFPGHFHSMANNPQEVRAPLWRDYSEVTWTNKSGIWIHSNYLLWESQWCVGNTAWFSALRAGIKVPGFTADHEWSDAAFGSLSLFQDKLPRTQLGLMWLGEKIGFFLSAKLEPKQTPFVWVWQKPPKPTVSISMNTSRNYSWNYRTWISTKIHLRWISTYLGQKKSRKRVA